MAAADIAELKLLRWREALAAALGGGDLLVRVHLPVQKPGTFGVSPPRDNFAATHSVMQRVDGSANPAEILFPLDKNGATGLLAFR
jgi:hypothetical protein